MALEEMFYGRPLSPLDFQLSVSLGTNTVSDKSLTNHRGFLGLAPHSHATSEETTPPLHNWTRDALQKMRIERIFPLCQVLDAAPSVTGSALIRVLLGDIYKRNTDLPLGQLCGDSPPGKLIGALSLEDFCKDLATKDSFTVPNTFGRARILVEKAGKDVQCCLLKGFVEEKVSFFPAIKFRDIRNTKKMWWNRKDFVQILQGDQEPSPLSKVATMTLQVCMEIERRSFAYSRSLEKYRDHGMPWMEKVLSRLPTALGKNTLLEVVTFLSCVGLIMNGDFVDYNHLRDLLTHMGHAMSQAQLQKLQILSRFTLPKVYNMLIWKIHESIPVRALPPGPKSTKPPAPYNSEEETIQPEEDVQEAEEQDGIRPMVQSPAMCLPANSSKLWTDFEKSLINLDTTVKLAQAYNLYVCSCREHKIPARTRPSFQKQRWTMMKTLKK